MLPARDVMASRLRLPRDMARDIWVISDTHFNHANILDFRDDLGNKIRPFSSVQEMNEKIVDRWNSMVKPGDIVYHLGDVAFGSKEEFAPLWNKLHGSKRLVVGNHDDIKWLSSGGFFKKISMWRQFIEHGLVLTHVPINETGLVRLKSGEKNQLLVNVHGHIHHNPSPPGRYINVSCEATSYYPRNLEDLALEGRELCDS